MSNAEAVCVIAERIGDPPRICPCSLVTAQGGRCAYGPRLGETCDKEAP